MAQEFCTECGGKLPGAAKFCPSCGQKVLGQDQATVVGKQQRSFAPLNLRNVIMVLLASAVVLAIGMSVSSDIAGVKPQVLFEEMQARNDPQLSDPAVKRLREIAESAPQDKQAWKALGEVLLGKLQSSEKPTGPLIFETIDVLRKILELDGQDAFALINMAEISLNQQVFDKASSYYLRYLQVVPDDHIARSRYASALTFQGKTDEGIAELTQVLADEPNNFHALAYLAVAYAQTGKKPLAIQTAEQALKFAPNEEARARFSDFLAAVREDRVGESAVTEQKEPTRDTEKLHGLEAFLKANPIAGPKFAGATIQADTITVIFNDFPMDKMPPAIREKFVDSVAAKARETIATAKMLVFKDTQSNAELARVTLQK